MKRALLIEILPVLAGVVVLSIIVGTAGLDVGLSSKFYDPTGGWIYQNEPIWWLLYHYGNVPALTLGIGGFVVFLLSFRWLAARPFRKIAIFFTLLLIIGPGLIVHAVKDVWGRPRPRQVEALSGGNTYLDVWQKGVTGKGKSFPSGHAAVGFYLLAPYFVFRNGSKQWARAFLAIGLSYGALMGMGRIVQGGHFLTDVIWSAGLVYCTGVILYYLFRFDRTIWWEPRATPGT